MGIRPSKSKSAAMKKADKYMSLYVRLRDADHRGLCQCITCGKWGSWKSMDMGHFISRDRQATRYDEQNAHAQCKECNRFKSGNQYEHGLAIDKKYGPGTAAALLEKSKIKVTRRESDFEWIAKQYRDKYNQIK